MRLLFIVIFLPLSIASSDQLSHLNAPIRYILVGLVSSLFYFSTLLSCKFDFYLFGNSLIANLLVITCIQFWYIVIDALLSSLLKISHFVNLFKFLVELVTCHITFSFLGDVRPEFQQRPLNDYTDLFYLVLRLELSLVMIHSRSSTYPTLL